MAFTADELTNIANALIDYHYDTPKVRSQSLQDKPFLQKMRSKKKTFPGGKDNITLRAKGTYTTTLQGFNSDDTVTYANPTNIKTATYPWKLVHSGINFTMDEMLKAGITITNSNNGKGETTHTNAEKVVLANLLTDKVEDMMEGTDRGMNEMLWKDGTQDAKEVPGLQSFILDDPTTVTTVAGIPQATETWWQNRAAVGQTLGDTTGDNQFMMNLLQNEERQLRRYGGRPDCRLAGSDMMERIELELKARGVYTQTGWANSGMIDGSIGEVGFKGTTFVYDPTLDDLGKEKYLYVLDSRTIYPMFIEGQDGAKHAPSRPENKYVFYRAMTSALGLVCNQRNANGVYSFT